MDLLQVGGELEFAAGFGGEGCGGGAGYRDDGECTAVAIFNRGAGGEIEGCGGVWVVGGKEEEGEEAEVVAVDFAAFFVFLGI